MPQIIATPVCAASQPASPQIKKGKNKIREPKNPPLKFTGLPGQQFDLIFGQKFNTTFIVCQNKCSQFGDTFSGCSYLLVIGNIGI